MIPEITIDASKAFAKFSDTGIPESVRKNLRMMLPSLAKLVGDSVERKLDTELKSRNTLTVKQELRENPTAVYAKVYVTSQSAGGLLPQYLETGTRPHEILGNPFLAFFWERMGINVVLRRVNHPGFAGIHYMENTLFEMEAQIVDTLTDAARAGAREA